MAGPTQESAHAQDYEDSASKIENLNQKMKQFAQNDPNWVMKEKLAARIAEHVRNTVGDAKQAKIVDIGCAVGGDIGMMLAVMPECAGMTGVDIMDNVLEQARADYPAPTTFIKGDIHDMHFFDDNSQDVVRCCKVLIHADLPKAIEEMIRVLKPGGLATFIEGDFSKTSIETEVDTVRKVFQVLCAASMKRMKNPAAASESYDYVKSHSAVEGAAIESDTQFVENAAVLEQILSGYRPFLEALVGQGDISQNEMDTYMNAFQSGDAKMPFTLFTVSFTKK